MGPEHLPAHAIFLPVFPIPALEIFSEWWWGKFLCLGHLLRAMECVGTEIQTPAGFPAAGAASSQECKTRFLEGNNI